jgi:hypothetical protein
MTLDPSPLAMLSHGPVRETDPGDEGVGFVFEDPQLQLSRILSAPARPQALN